MSKNIISLFPKHHIYCEVFGGGGQILFAKEPSPVEVYNDIDEGLVNFFRVLRNPEKMEELKRRLELTPYSRREYYDCRDTWDKQLDDIERALQWFVVVRQSFGGKFNNGWGFNINIVRQGMSKNNCSWINTIENFPIFTKRLLRVQIECNDFRKILNTYDTAETLFYCDSPYAPDTCSASMYAHNLLASDHADLVSILLNIKGMIILSGYETDIYKPLLDAGWVIKKFDTTCRIAGRTSSSSLQGIGNVLEKQKRTECVYVSPNAQKLRKEPLFDISEALF